MSNALGTELHDMGLDALLADLDEPVRIHPIPLRQIKPCPNQPRQHFNQEALDTLTTSIKKHGVLQAILVQKNGESYEIIAGERRWRAAKAAGLTDIPAVIKQVTESERATLALIENVQREDLSAIEKAEALQQLLQTHQLSHRQLAEQVGLSRSSITNLLRLLELDPLLQAWVQDGSLSMGHARALLAAPEATRNRLAQQIIDQQMSVRALEKTLRHDASNKPSTPRKQAHTSSLLSHTWQTPVRIQHQPNSKKNQLIIQFDDQQALTHLLKRLGLSSSQCQQAWHELTSQDT